MESLWKGSWRHQIVSLYLSAGREYHAKLKSSAVKILKQIWKINVKTSKQAQIEIWQQKKLFGWSRGQIFLG